MKKQFITLIALLFLFFNSHAQDFPKGIKYQAVARDLSGNIISEKNISLKVTLFSLTEKEENGRNPVYSELHQTKTNKFGLFALTIGEGIVELGKFKKIPWSNKEIWMAVDIDMEGGNNFSVISESKLLAVPYAIHAQSASTLTNGDSDITRAFEPGMVWEIGGNVLKPEQEGILGTLNYQDVFLITGGMSRVTITADGDVQMTNDLDVAGQSSTGSLTSEGNVDLNTQYGATTIGGNTLIKGKATIKNDLDVFSNFNVDGVSILEGETFVQSNLEVSGNVSLNSGNQNTSTSISGPTTINNTLDVDESTHLNIRNGTTTVEGPTTIHNTLDVDNTVHINKVSGTTTIEGATRVNDIVDIEKSVHLNIVDGTTTIDGATDINNTLDVDASVNLNSVSGTTNINGPTSLASTLNVNGTTTIEGATVINNSVTIDKNISGDPEDFEAYPLRVEGSDRGISIKVNADTPDGDNHFVTFFDDGGGARGAIQGQTETEVLTDPEYLYETASITADIVLAAVNLVSSLGSVEACGGVGGVVCPPDAAQIAQALAEQVKVLADMVAFQVFAFINVGVTYESGGADYAEWLERLNFSEKINHGDIVGVVGGKISKNTTNASQYLVISTNPAVLGNMPKEGQENKYEKVAFMGQIPVKVRGKVNLGDYILPSGLNDGTGIAISPDRIQPSQYSKIVGVAWTTTAENTVLSWVNMAIGLNTNDVAKLVNIQQEKIERLENNYANLEQRLSALESGNPMPVAVHSSEPEVVVQKTDAQNNFVSEIPTRVELDQKMIEDAISNLKEIYLAQGVDIENHYGYNKLFNDETFRTEVIQKVLEHYDMSRALIEDVEDRN